MSGSLLYFRERKNNVLGKIAIIQVYAGICTASFFPMILLVEEVHDLQSRDLNRPTWMLT